VVKVGGQDDGGDGDGPGKWPTPCFVDTGDALETGGAEEVFMVKRGHELV
jgi:hypothetical protein